MYGGVTITLYDITVALACKKGVGYPAWDQFE